MHFFLFLYIKTLLEVIKINKSNINDIIINKSPKDFVYGEIIVLNNVKCLCLGPDDNGKNMFGIIPTQEVKPSRWAEYKSKLHEAKFGSTQVFNKSKSGKWMTNHIRQKYDNDITEDTIWWWLNDNEYIPSIKELKKIVANAEDNDETPFDIWTKLGINDQHGCIWTSTPDGNYYSKSWSPSLDMKSIGISDRDYLSYYIICMDY